MAKDNYAEQGSQTGTPPTQDQLLEEAMRFFERLNDNARNTPSVAPLEGEAQKALESFRATAARLEVRFKAAVRPE